MGAMRVVLLELAGWGGAGCMLLAYGLLCTKRLTAGPVFQSLNLAGGLGLVISGVENRAWPSVTLNLVWALISITSLIQHQERSRPTPTFLVDPRLRRKTLEATVRTLATRYRRYVTGDFNHTGWHQHQPMPERVREPA